MRILTAPTWNEYELLDSGHGRRLERFGHYRLSRPDPQTLWQPSRPQAEWDAADAAFVEEGKKGRWQLRTSVPSSWNLRYENLTFVAKLSPFKHTGIFPEQAAHWGWMNDILTSVTHPTNVLNLFGYTGAASLVAANTGATVTHVDASRPTIGWARENQALSGLTDKPIRWILDDALKFVRREERRGVRYDGIIMDPPVFGHGPNGERWDFTEHFPQLLAACKAVLSREPAFLIINAYAVSASGTMLGNMLTDLNLGGTVDAGELAIKETGRDRLLSTGIYGRWSRS